MKIKFLQKEKQKGAEKKKAKKTKRSFRPNDSFSSFSRNMNDSVKNLNISRNMMTSRINDSLDQFRFRKPSHTRCHNTKMEEAKEDPEPVSKPSLMFQKFMYQNLNSKYIKDKFVPDFEEAKKYNETRVEYLAA